MKIQPYDKTHLEAIVRLSIRAWEPVFSSLQKTMHSEIYQAFFPDWRESQKQSVTTTCESPDITVWCALEDSEVTGFVAVKLHEEDKLGEIYMIAIDPTFQNRGFAKALMVFATDWLKQAEMSVVMVETGGDPGHEPARALYESEGFRAFPVVRYFKKL